MKTETQGPMRPTSDTPALSPNTKTEQRVLTPGQWARVVLGVNAPFGHDRLPTVFG